MINMVIGAIIGLLVGYGSSSMEQKSIYKQGVADGVSKERQQRRMQATKDNSCVLWWTQADGRTLVQAKRAVCGR